MVQADSPCNPFSSQINALLCHLNCDFHFIFADNTDNFK